MEKCLFQITNPALCHGSAPDPKLDEVGLRFIKMREMITSKGNVPAQSRESFTIKWEQMIAQMSMNMSRIITESDDTVLISPGCTWDAKNRKWNVATNQCVDLEIVDARVEESDPEWYAFFKHQKKEDVLVDDDENIILSPEDSLQYAGIPQHQKENLIFRDSVFFDDGYPQFHVFFSNKGSLADEHAKTYHNFNVVIVKIGVPGHYTMALVYINENRIEFFDSAGTYDVVGWEKNDPNKPFSETLAQRSKIRGQEQHKFCVYENETRLTDFAICNSMSILFPGYSIVGINPGNNLQIDSRDAYCNTWIWLYTYVKFVNPKWSTRTILKYFEALTKSASVAESYSPDSLNVIENFWDYIIYLPYW